MRAAMGEFNARMQEVFDYYLKCSIGGRNPKSTITGSSFQKRRGENFIYKA
jgi:hypothetical protein